MPSKWYRLSMGMDRNVKVLALIIGFLASSWAEYGSAATPAEVLYQAQSLAAINRYSEALSLLEPFLADDLTDHTSWEIAAEAGRAAFHLGQYAKSHEILRRVVEARPVVFEPAVYLEATAYLMGDHVQAFAIFEAILQSKAQDLYLAVTLPGEKRFLAEPEVQTLLKRYAQPLLVRPDHATVQGNRLGQSHQEIVQQLGLSNAVEGRTLSARAGPFLTWIYTFNDDGLLNEVIYNASHIRRYTPFILDLSGGISWASTPIECIGSLGAPQETSATVDGALIATWKFPEAWLDLVFSRSDSARSGAATLEIVRIYRQPSLSAAAGKEKTVQ